MRFFFDKPLPGFNEVVEVGIAVAVAATFPAGASGRVNIRMDLLSSRIGPVTISRLECLGAAFLLVFYILLAWQLGLHAADLQERGATTVFLGWRRAPFMWAVAVFVAICACTQLIVFLVSVRDMLTSARTHGPVPEGYAKILSNSTFWFWTVGLDRKSTRLNSSHIQKSRMPSSA